MKYVHLRIPASEKREIPEGIARLAERRTAHLAGMTMRESLGYLLASAYMQGLDDAMDVFQMDDVRIEPVIPTNEAPRFELLSRKEMERRFPKQAAALEAEAAKKGKKR